VSAATSTDVLVVGAGPSGLLAAIELARHGVLATVVERDRTVPREARATAIQPGTLEILAQAGMIEQFLGASEHVRCTRICDEDLTPVAETRFAGAGCEWEFQCCLPQYVTEQILIDRLNDLGVRVERGVTVESVHERSDGVLVNVQQADGTPDAIEASWVVGAGGAHSVTRDSMHGVLAGETYPGSALVADVQVSSELPRDASALIATRHGYVLLAPLPQDRWITFIGDLEKDEADRLERDRSVAAVAATLTHRIPAAVQLTDVTWAAVFRMHHRLVAKLADRHRFLLGDAGHLSSPFGGEGLNSGLHDGHNLAWKLALVLSGRAKQPLLDTFATERELAAEHVLAVSDQVHHLAHRAVEAAQTGERLHPPTAAEAARFVRSRSMLDFRYPDSPLTGEHHTRGDRQDGLPAPGDRFPGRTGLHGTTHHLLVFGPAPEARLAQLRDRWTGLVEVTEAADDDRQQAGLAADGAVLVRPDGYIGFRAAPADAAGLEAMDSHLSSYLIPA